MSVVSGGGGSHGSYGGGGYSSGPMSSEAKAAWGSIGVVATVLVIVGVAAGIAGVGSIATALLSTPMTALLLALSGLLTIPGAADLFGAALVGAAAGFAIGWLKRARVVRGGLDESFVGALFSSRIWADPTRYSLLELGVRTLVGYSIGLAFSAQSVGGMFGVYFRAAPPESYAQVMECDKNAFNRFFHAMLAQGVYLAPSAFEAGFVSAAHGEVEISATIEAASVAFAKIAAA